MPGTRAGNLDEYSQAAQISPRNAAAVSISTKISDIVDLRGKKILGINPPVWDFAWFDLWAKPLGLLRALGNIRARGNDVSLLDCMHEGRLQPMSFGRWQVRREERVKPGAYANVPRRFHRFGMRGDKLEKRLESLAKPDIVLVTSVMTYWHLGVREAIFAARRAFPGVPVLLGGIYATLCPEHAATLGADAVFSGRLPDDDGPIPMDLYDEPTYGVFLTSHGCPMQCDYCASRILSPAYRARPLENIISDLEFQLRHGKIKDVAFYDDALLWERENSFYPLCEHVRKKFPG
ncbi:cobalamin-dependent protein, partial [Synergistaceae bacterium OttesenSCG-928-I11]|nr:cobalamin-dependent protein [Synergistaceae bacterium OttesenSCG-928-I11]